MRIVIQRVSQASVSIDDEIVGKIAHGALVFLGIETDDLREDADWLVSKLVKLRIFPDEKGVMNLDIGQVGGQFLVVSQFTLHASTKKGNRPSYIRSAPPEGAIPLYEYFVKKLEVESGRAVETGRFGADMAVGLVNDGPVTILIDSRNKE
ncbi:MAG: D-tyrosyl-tRNA(Tyr) deacylase [Bacteroidota bacterium]|nr:D-tyrosyl-tRNA(Tyr) deacylase [Bacteroidota bacterium]MDX5405209.1 D-tyrosyl-tRNA(Tyr) deacylase [Bacteroidota bacterium]MDX5429046.1 D-tyrosyl-tRNA(Tyr) deacylase [Bacteroidota bacterium]MDX5448160.1 D-tyrosyl-tRNA(Tyr) deacylase [Bacteroidota bacterium]MDX5506710.1 D-tyrosyl-tRNA(Tyr) deacylase [Bacteroidota bacterium]